MLFFVKCVIKDMPPIPPETFAALSTKSLQMTVDLKDQGKVLAGGSFINGNGACGIVECVSTEEAALIVLQNPLYGMADFEVIALNPLEFALETSKQGLTAMRGTK